jgi:hypothetical protein
MRLGEHIGATLASSRLATLANSTAVRIHGSVHPSQRVWRTRGEDGIQRRDIPTKPLTARHVVAQGSGFIYSPKKGAGTPSSLLVTPRIHIRCCHQSSRPAYAKYVALEKPGCTAPGTTCVTASLSARFYSAPRRRTDECDVRTASASVRSVGTFMHVRCVGLVAHRRLLASHARVDSRPDTWENSRSRPSPNPNRGCTAATRPFRRGITVLARQNFVGKTAPAHRPEGVVRALFSI